MKWHRLMVALFLAATLVVTVQQMTKPDEAKACPECLVALPLEEGIAYAVFGTTAITVISHAVNHSGAPHVARQAVAHPHRFRALIKWAHQNQSRGQRVWQNAHRHLKGVFRWFGRHYTLRHMKRKLPGAAIACVTSGLYTWATSGSFHQGLLSCVGAAIGVFGVPGAKVELPMPAVVRAMIRGGVR